MIASQDRGQQTHYQWNGVNQPSILIRFHFSNIIIKMLTKEAKKVKDPEWTKRRLISLGQATVNVKTKS